MAVLIIAIPLTVYLAQTQQIFKSRASSSPVLDAFEIKDSEGNPINCDSSTNPPTCTTSTQDITIKIKDLGALIPK